MKGRKYAIENKIATLFEALYFVLHQTRIELTNKGKKGETTSLEKRIAMNCFMLHQNDISVSVIAGIFHVSRSHLYIIDGRQQSDFMKEQCDEINEIYGKLINQ